MTIRTRETTVTFRRPFTPKGLDAPQSAGDHRLVVDEEAIPDISFPAYRRVATMLHLPAIVPARTSREVHRIDPDDLARAPVADAGG